MRHVISALVTNEPGVLASVAGMFAARGFNIDSLVVGRTDDPGLSRMTVVVDGDDNTIAQVQSQLAKLVPVAKVRDLTSTAYVERDLALIKVDAPADRRGEIVEMINMFRGKVVDVAPDSLTLELTGPEEKIEAFLDLVKEYGVREMARTGVIAMSRGYQSARSPRARHLKAAEAPKRVRSLEGGPGEALPPS